MRSFLLTFLTAAALGYLTLLVGMYVFQRRLLYHPDRSSPAPLRGMAEIWLQAADGVRLNGWFAPAQGNAGVIVYLHGNAGNLGMLEDKLAAYLGAGLGVLAIDWRGYGKSAGSPSEEGLYADGRAALAFLAEKGVPLSRVVLHGESLGSGVATLLAVENQLAGLVLEAPFISVAETAQHHYPYLPARWLVKDRFDSLARIGKITVPLLILHCSDDRTVPVSHGQTLLAAAGPKAEGRFFAQGGHMGVFDQGGKEVALTFIKRIFERN
ncbi:MAG: alpha/beta hydrolase [Alphaproteobacteria bacterium]|nr:alpha/beta hydrolase [Alphaproteobacteria bacterium]